MDKDIQVFALSTCIHCKHCKEFFKEHDIPIRVVHVDLLEGDEQREVMREVRKYNPDCSFPTVVVNNGEEVLVGFSEQRYTEEFL